MEKKVVCALLFLLASSCVFAATAAQAPVTAAAAAAVTSTAFWEDDNLMQATLKEFRIDITPEFQLVLPDASLKIGLKQKLGDTVLDASTEYNYIYNKIRYDIRYSIELYMTFSANLYDAVNFEQLYKNDKYIQRNKGFGVSVQSPEILDCLILREEFRSDTYYFARLDNSFFPDRGSILMLNSWLEIDLTFSGKKIHRADRFAVNFEKSIPSAYSSYNFLFLEVYLSKKFDLDAGRVLSLKFEGGYLLEKNNAPIWQVYRLGGYERMLGYNYDEIQGEYMDFVRVKYEMPLLEKINWELPLIRVDALKMFVVADMGSAGGDHEVVNINHYKYSVGLGLIIEFTFRKRTPIKMTFALGQAIQQGKLPVFYFVHEF